MARVVGRVVGRVAAAAKGPAVDRGHPAPVPHPQAQHGSSPPAVAPPHIPGPVTTAKSGPGGATRQPFEPAPRLSDQDPNQDPGPSGSPRPRAGAGARPESQSQPEAAPKPAPRHERVRIPAETEFVSEITATVHAVLEPFGLVRVESGLIVPAVWTGESDAPDRGRHVRVLEDRDGHLWAVPVDHGRPYAGGGRPAYPPARPAERNHAPDSYGEGDYL